MSSRMLIEFICDECACVETFVHLECNQIGAVAKVGMAEAAAKRGWTIKPFQDSKLLVMNLCKVCSESKGKP